MAGRFFFCRMGIYLLLPLFFVRLHAQDHAGADGEGHNPAQSEPALPDMMKGTFWEILAKVKYDPMADPFIPYFPAEVQKFKGQTVELIGFMIPLDPAKEQSRFVLTPYPLGGCFFCSGGGGGPESLVEVRPKKPIAFTYDPLTISGRLELLHKDPSELFFRISDAVLVQKRDQMR